MKGIDRMGPVGPKAIGEGAKLEFIARGAGRSSTINVWQPPRRLVLTSTQGGVSAAYDYTCKPTTEGGTEIALDARCTAEGFVWKLLHPLIALLMRRSDGGQLASLARVMSERV
jgi:hypothetical protein